jgi:hypothetical protein
MAGTVGKRRTKAPVKKSSQKQTEFGLDEKGLNPVLELADTADLYQVRRSWSENLRDKDYADYWLKEYGNEPDEIRTQQIFPVLQEEISKFADGGLVYDLGSGAGSAVREVLSWNCRQYIGVDINKTFIDSTKVKFRHERVKFFRRTFEAPDWFHGLPLGYEVAISLFAINEIASPKNFLLGAKKLAEKTVQKRRRHGSKVKPLLALVFTHPALILKDLSDFHYLRSNQRKFENIDFYKMPSRGSYKFSRGNFAIDYHHWPLDFLINTSIGTGWRIQKLFEISHNERKKRGADARDIVANQFPKYVVLILSA